MGRAWDARGIWNLHGTIHRDVDYIQEYTRIYKNIQEKHHQKTRCFIDKVQKSSKNATVWSNASVSTTLMRSGAGRIDAKRSSAKCHLRNSSNVPYIAKSQFLTVTLFLNKMWLLPFGVPVEVICDADGSFMGEFLVLLKNIQESTRIYKNTQEYTRRQSSKNPLFYRQNSRIIKNNMFY